MAGHERKHNAFRADTGGYVSGYTYIDIIDYLPLSTLISRIRSPQSVLGSWSDDEL